jgi:hypothetical protein
MPVMERNTWQPMGIGPVQHKRVVTAIRALLHEGQTHTRVSSTGTRRHAVDITEPWSPVRADVLDLYQELGQRFSWELTPGNYRTIIGELEGATALARSRRPQIVEPARPSPNALPRIAELRALLTKAG